jgi:hypothetical protein
VRAASAALTGGGAQDLGIASELWDIQYIMEWKQKHAVEVWCEHATTKQRKKLWRRKDRPAIAYPWCVRHTPVAVWRA